MLRIKVCVAIKYVFSLNFSLTNRFNFNLFSHSKTDFMIYLILHDNSKHHIFITMTVQEQLLSDLLKSSSIILNHKVFKHSHFF